MPIYEYTCTGCGKRFEQLREMRDTSPALCPACGKAGEREIASRTSIIGGRESGHPGCCGGMESCDTSRCGHAGGCGCGK